MKPLFESNPLPNELIALWLALPGIWLGAKALCNALAADRAVCRIVQPAIALAAWIVAVQLASMAARSFWIGLPVGMSVLSIAGLALWWKSGGSLLLSVAATATERTFPRAMWLSMTVATAPIALMSLLGHFHDDILPNQHMSMVAQLQNDYFPPSYLGFTHIPLRYHYGSDLVCAGLTALTRLRVDLAIQWMTIFGWAYCWCLLWVLGQRLTNSKRGALLTAAATMLGGGLVVLMGPLALDRFAKADTLLRSLLGMYSLGDRLPLRTITLEYFFNHPFCAAFPLATAALLVVANYAPGRGVLARNIVLMFLLVSLSLTHDVLFVTLTATLAFTEIILGRRWPFVFTLAGALAASWACGGLLFTSIPGSPPLGLYPRFWPTEYAGWLWPARLLLWHILTFIPLLPLGLFGARYVVSPLRWPLLLLVAGSLATPIFVGYAYSFDILKFSVVALFSLGILAGTGLNSLADRKGWRWRVVFGVALVSTVMTATFAIGGILWVQLNRIETISTYFTGPMDLGQDDRQAVAWLRRRASPDEIIYRAPEVSIGYMQNGLPSTPIPVNTNQFGVPKRRVAALTELLKTLPSDLAAYRAVGIVWFVVAPDDPRMESNTSRWLAAGEIALKAQFGDVKIYRAADRDAPAGLQSARPN